MIDLFDNLWESWRSKKENANGDTKDYLGRTALHIAAKEGLTEVAVELIKAGANINAKDKDGYTPLHFAATYSHPETAIAIIKAGGTQ